MECDVEDRTFTFDELSDKAKAKARDAWRYSPGHLDYAWWEYTYEDAVRIGRLMGLEIGEFHERTHSGRTYTKPDIWFRGFCSQGDGACWGGVIATEKLQGAVARVKAEAPGDEELHRIAALAEGVFAQVASIAAMNRLLPEDEDPDYPEIVIGVGLPIKGEERGYSSCFDSSRTLAELPDELEKAVNELAGDFADWIYDQLEAEHDHLMSDEVVDEAIENAGLLFDEDGNEAT